MRNSKYLLQLLPLSFSPSEETLLAVHFFPTLTPFLRGILSCSSKSQLDAPAPLIKHHCPALFVCAIPKHLCSLSTDTLSCGSNTCWCTWRITKCTPNIIFQLRKFTKQQWERDAGEKPQGKEANWKTDSPHARSREMGLLGIPRFTRGPKSDFLLFKSRLKYNKRLPA